MKLETPRNINYSATVVKLQSFVDLPNCDNVKHALIFGNSVIVSKASEAGEIGLFFPVECQLSPEFMAANNLYRKAEWGNADPTKTGFFEQHGRVKAMKFRGHKSEGYWINVNSLLFVGINVNDLNEGDTFDKIGNHEICKKYIAGKSGLASGGPNNKVSKLKDNIVDGQFKFHFDTDNFRKNLHKIKPTDYISISDKWHGTSAIYSKPLVVRKLNWFERILKKIGIRVQDSTYGFVYSSRRVIKCVDGKYGTDVYGIVAKEIADKIPNSYTVYGEIVGYNPEGWAAIQSAAGGRPYHYGCAPGEHKFVIYRVKTTNVDGKTLELSWPQMKEFCSKYGLSIVHEFFYGPITALVPFSDFIFENETESEQIGKWQKQVLAYLEKTFVNDQMCKFNNFEVPAEGVVIRIDFLDECESYKLKNFKFLEDETKNNDAGILDMETAEAEQL